MLIPAGASNINIREVAPSNNYLAIRNLTGHYYLNGNWKIDFPRPLTFADAIWHYDRRPRGFAAPDTITCIGSTSEPVYLVLLYQDRNVGIKYEYSVPESAVRDEPETYTWAFGPFGECSSECGGGVQTRTVRCNKQSSLEQVDDGLCDSTSKPNDAQKCGSSSCPPRWVESDWGKCSAACGSNGTQTRTVNCEETAASGTSTKVADAICLEVVGKKPVNINSCNVGTICPEWHFTNWKPVRLTEYMLKCLRKTNREHFRFLVQQIVRARSADTKSNVLQKG